jgi:DNA glycosylase AlkZ-like
MAARVLRFDPADLDAAFSAGTVVKATLMRVTLHAVTAADYPVFHRAMAELLRAARLVDPRRVRVGDRVVDPDELVAALAAFAAEPRTGTELQDRLEELTGSRDQRLWRAVRTFAPLLHVPDHGPWSFTGSTTLVAAPATTGQQTNRAESVAGLLRRYIEGFGPASARDCAQFTMLRMSEVRAALADLGDRLVQHVGPGGETLVDVADGQLADPGADAPARLLGMWDSTLLAYADRTRVLPPEYRSSVIRRNGDVLPALLVDGQVAGVWRPVADGIEATAFHRLDRATWAELAGEAADLQALLADRDPNIYRRYGHWWAKELPSTQRRVLPG